ncbi:MAG: hypothetical protein ACI93T_001546, partial [Porticoccaceae bacterium]
KARAIVLVAVSLIATVIFSPFPVTMLLPILMFGCVGVFVVASLPED